MKECTFQSCKCKHPDAHREGMARREFLARALAAGAAGTLLGGTSHADLASLYASGRAGERAAVLRALEEWSGDLFELGAPRIYWGEGLSEISMPLGGIGAGHLYLSGRGDLVSWQLVNNFRSAMDDVCGFFGVHTRDIHGTTVARRLRKGPEGAGGVADIQACCEYPYLTLAYQDDALPVDITLEAWSPIEPGNTRDSALPGAVFTFRVHNPQNSKVTVSLLASLQNRVGWDGYAPTGDDGLSNLDYEGNENHLEARRDATLLHMGARAGAQHRLTKPCSLYALEDNLPQTMRLCGKLNVVRQVPDPAEMPEQTVFWIGPGDALPAEEDLAAILDAARRGASLVVADAGGGLLGQLAHGPSAAAHHEVFDDFESGDYMHWTLEGDAFGDAPASGTLPGQNAVSGYRGRRLVNTFLGGDGATGSATSRSFTLDRPYIHFLIGGGNHSGRTCMNLVVEGAVAHTATGRNSERLQWRTWDVRALRGREAHLEIVDQETGGWGHINIDHILFSGHAAPPLYGPDTFEALRQALPFEFQGLSVQAGPHVVAHVAPALDGHLSESLRKVPQCHRFAGLSLREHASTPVVAQDGSPLALLGTYGAGRVLVLNGLYHDALSGQDCRRLIGGTLAMLLDAEYHPRTGLPEDAPAHGAVVLAALHDGGSLRVHALPQGEEDSGYWNAFSKTGDFSEAPEAEGPSASGRSWNGALAAQFELAANTTETVTFLIAWNFPNRMRDRRYGWGPPPMQYDHRLGNRYNHWFANAGEVADYLIRRHTQHDAAARAFHQALYGTTLPRWLLDAVAANIAALRSPLYMWLEDGTVAAFEGTDSCCPMNCTHVFNYAMTPAFLFPELERNVRETDLLVQMHPTEHFIPHRTILPLSLPRLGFEIGGPHHPALDGEFGTLLKTCREWRQCGDHAWLARLYPAVKTHLTYLMRTHDTSGDGVIRGEQPNTYDIHTYGSNTFIGSLYLAALRAVEEMALAMEDTAFAQTCRERYELSTANYDKTCWNGEYYYNVYDAPEATPETYNAGNCWGEGCHADQLLGQWWANMLGLGHVLPREHVRDALRAIVRHCWRGLLDLPEHRQRVFADPWERGLLNCAWPRGERPEHPVLYCDEVWTGIEYEVAALLLHEGMLEDGLRIVKAARDRYTGNQRNPYSEVECGGHYARALSSYSLLTAAAGLEYDASKGFLAFAPRFPMPRYQTFFTAAHGYGTLCRELERQQLRLTISIVSGSLTLNTLKLELPVEARPEVSTTGTRATFSANVHEKVCQVQFDRPVRVESGRDLMIMLRWEPNEVIT